MSEHVNKAESSAKKQKLIDRMATDHHQAVVALVPNEDSPRIFKLNIDCFDEIFDYLSTADLLGIGQTCKTMQQVVGEYFKENYTAASMFGGNDGIYRVFSINGMDRAETSGFNKFVRYMSHSFNSLGPLRYIETNGAQFTSLQHLYLIGVDLVTTRVNCLRNNLHQFEIIQIKQCTFQCDFYESFLKLCTNLRQLYIQYDIGDIIRVEENDWLQKNYPKLEHLELTPIKLMQFNVSELAHFLHINPSVRSFSTSIRFLWENQQKFLRSGIQLDTFGVKIGRNYGLRFRDVLDVETSMIFDLLNQLYAQGFYKQLHLFVTHIDEEYTNEIVSVRGLEKLCIKNYIQSYNLPLVTNLKELSIMDTTPTADMEILANGLVNLERLYLCKTTYNDILPFIRQSVKLNRIIVKGVYFSENIFKVSTMNKEREKLKNARKVTIYVPDDLFVTIKWATPNGDTDLKLVEIKRCDSYRWDHHYY
ncbi:uncharacterized protein LOC129568837 isoform X3 [Sitodiplosis mosellana]|uniref:uncharacterized protein LOC129568837 isoform X3 n=1 Tax=Sitodiplosis mosellana TaxID=263140 RepID=UPI002444F5DC|nr:uncharacterized protein LOC129568837 isoform X3 [Sitodiplosis mosellana]XP_055303135.1 uncharacterized protein LOC129568837 isoform X3 [Sitodiplosis mosellana]